MKLIMQKYGDRKNGRKANFRPYAHAVCRTPMSDEVQMVVEVIFNGEEGTEVHPGVEVQPERLGVPDGGVSPCLNCGAHHGCEPKIAIVNEIDNTQTDERLQP